MEIDATVEKELLVTFGQRVKDARKRLGMSQQQFAEKAGISVPYLSEIENGKKKASIIALYSICTGTGVSPNEIITGPEIEKPLSEILIGKSPELSPEEVDRLYKYFKSLHEIRNIAE